MTGTLDLNDNVYGDYDSAAEAAVRRALLSLEGLSVGDAFGETFFGEPADIAPRIARRQLDPGPWRWTDDTEMAVAVCSQLAARGTVDQHDLARRFAFGMSAGRGYGWAAHEILTAIRAGRPWRDVSRSAFAGAGSLGNGAAMRAGPLGAYFADRPLATVVDEARRSAEVTHAHEEGIAGAIAIAVAAALAWRDRERTEPRGREWLAAVRSCVPSGQVRDGIDAALSLAPDAPPAEAAAVLGSGSRISAPDTVPLCLWAAAHQEGYAAALWTTVAALGDRDTTCAIVGSIVVLKTGRGGIPAGWRRRREPLPAAVRGRR